MKTLEVMAEQAGFALTREQLGRFAIYQSMLLEWNQKMNLTAITQPEEIAAKHFLDSLMLLKALDIPRGATLIDVGTGAGFPGVAIKITRPDLHITLLDSLQKRIRFLSELSAALEQENQVLHGRAEELARVGVHREAYDIATARAVAALPVLCEYCLPFVKPGGYFLAMKGPSARQELAAAEGAIQELGGAARPPFPYHLPGSNRAICIIRKTSQTPAIFPRKSHKIAKAPLG